MGVAAILMTLGAGAFRSYWMGQGLERSRDAVVTALRNAQQRAMAESHPIVYGVRFSSETAENRRWSIVSYDPRRTSAKCEVEESHTFDDGVVVSDVSFADEGLDAHDACVTDLGASGDEFAFFFARGNSTAGNLTLHSVRGERARNIEVRSLTGRVISE